MKKKKALEPRVTVRDMDFGYELLE